MKVRQYTNLVNTHIECFQWKCLSFKVLWLEWPLLLKVERQESGAESEGEDTRQRVTGQLSNLQVLREDDGLCVWAAAQHTELSVI